MNGFPPAFTKCADCGVREAAIYADGVPICWHCDGQEQPRKPKQFSVSSWLPTPKTEAPKENETMNKGTKRPRISEEIKAAIHAADPGIPNLVLAKKLGISDYSVNMIRRAAGIAPNRPRGKRPHPECPVAPVSANASKAGQISITICSAVSAERAKAIFAALAPHLQAVALQAAFARQFEEA